jgi:hypothetical protein
MEEPVIKPSAHAIIDYIKHIEEVCRGQDLRQQGSWSFRTLPGDMLWVSSARTHVKALEDNQVHASFHRWKAGVQREEMTCLGSLGTRGSSSRSSLSNPLKLINRVGSG